MPLRNLLGLSQVVQTQEPGQNALNLAFNKVAQAAFELYSNCCVAEYLQLSYTLPKIWISFSQIQEGILLQKNPEKE